MKEVDKQIEPNTRKGPYRKPIMSSSKNPALNKRTDETCIN